MKSTTITTDLSATKLTLSMPLHLRPEIGAGMTIGGNAELPIFQKTHGEWICTGYTPNGDAILERTTSPDNAASF